MRAKFVSASTMRGLEGLISAEINAIESFGRHIKQIEYIGKDDNLYWAIIHYTV